MYFVWSVGSRATGGPSAELPQFPSRAYSEPMIRFEADANGRAASFRTGEMFEIVLEETRMAGFKWAVEKGGESICTLAGESSDAPAGPPGHPGTHLWQFRAVQVGTTTILLRHRRPWESGDERGRVFQLQIQVTE